VSYQQEIVGGGGYFFGASCIFCTLLA